MTHTHTQKKSLMGRSDIFATFDFLSPSDLNPRSVCLSTAKRQIRHIERERKRDENQITRFTVFAR
jgi:hypothetical protein